MTIEETIRASAHRIADEVEPPGLDIELIRSRTLAERRRRIGIVTAVAATIAVCLVVPRLIGPPSSAPMPTDRPQGPAGPSGAVWADADGVHLGDRVVRLASGLRNTACGLDPACTGLSSLALVGGGVVYGDHESQRVWYQPWSGGRAEVVGEGSAVGPAADPVGTTAAWFDGTELVMYDTATGTELSRADQSDEGALPLPRRENAQGNEILEVTSQGVTWRAPGGVYHFDRASGETSEGPETTQASGNVVDVHKGWVASLSDASAVTEVISPERDTALKLEPDRLVGPMRFSADGRYVAGVNERDASGVTVADPRTHELFIPWRKDFYAWIGWGYGDTLMVIQDYEGTDDGNPFDKSRLLSCDISAQSCQRLPYRGAITLPNG